MPQFYPVFHITLRFSYTDPWGLKPVSYLKTKYCLRDFRRPSRSKTSSSFFCDVTLRIGVVSNVWGQHIGHVFKRHAVFLHTEQQYTTFFNCFTVILSVCTIRVLNSPLQFPVIHVLVHGITMSVLKITNNDRRWIRFGVGIKRGQD
jgi:hypothetical protein